MRENLKAVTVAVAIGLAAVGATYAAGSASPSPFRVVWCLHLAYGLPLAIAAGVYAARIRRWIGRLALLLAGVLALWASFVFGVSEGFRALQSMPDPPADAFADGGPMLGALFLGWFPATLAVGLAYLASALFRRHAHTAKPKA